MRSDESLLWFNMSVCHNVFLQVDLLAPTVIEGVIMQRHFPGHAELNVNRYDFKVSFRYSTDQRTWLDVGRKVLS